MLNRLTISNYALIDSLDITFPEGLVIITGETGAGKSILLGALSLLLGGRSDVSVINDKERNCVVEAEFCVEGNEYILRRVVSPAGRSRVFINDEPASLDDIRELSSKLVDIHAQHQHLLLSNADFQLSVLDAFTGIRQDVDEYNTRYESYLALKSQLATLDGRISEIARNRDYIEYQYKRLEDARLVPGELESLEQEQVQLAHSEQIKSDLGHICSIFSSEE
ncbi:MAG: AAA family ATPase, partial [Prevotellaceae bacterium]|nr:AAA family ATPase [Prevotellaceae bacterium]